MQAIRPAVIIIAVLSCLACAAAPAKPRLPEGTRKSIYYTNRGATLFNKGCHRRALDYFQSAHQRYTAADNLEKVAETLVGIGDIYYRLGDMPSALHVYDDALEVYRSLGDPSGTALSLSDKAAALIALERLDDAAATLDRADALPAAPQAALRLKTRALLSIRQNQATEARALLEKALAAAASGEEAIQSGIYFALGHLDLTENRPAAAKENFAEALRIDRLTGAYHDIARDLEALGNCDLRLEDHRAAVHHFKRSAKIFALLQEKQRAESVLGQLEASAAKTDMDVQATAQWVRQWLADPAGADLCH
ncbi:MAG: tetratricopeptide repeat protein [Desulfatitalea sp.]|nr:tetratricopeptide repeat protein [Desulfatitalea sp.]